MDNRQSTKMGRLAAALCAALIIPGCFDSIHPQFGREARAANASPGVRVVDAEDFEAPAEYFLESARLAGTGRKASRPIPPVAPKVRNSSGKHPPVFSSRFIPESSPPPPPPAFTAPPAREDVMSMAPPAPNVFGGRPPTASFVPPKNETGFAPAARRAVAARPEHDIDSPNPFERVRAKTRPADIPPPAAPALAIPPAPTVTSARAVPSIPSIPAAPAEFDADPVPAAAPYSREVFEPLARIESLARRFDEAAVVEPVRAVPAERMRELYEREKADPKRTASAPARRPPVAEAVEVPALSVDEFSAGNRPGNSAAERYGSPAWKTVSSDELRDLYSSGLVTREDALWAEPAMRPPAPAAAPAFGLRPPPDFDSETRRALEPLRALVPEASGRSNGLRPPS